MLALEDLKYLRAYLLCSAEVRSDVRKLLFELDKFDIEPGDESDALAMIESAFIDASKRNNS